ncbi:MFS transporter [Burkholderia gladioli]|uniref:MFS transporter n=1 Tax=Burkholderia gladioli TaxID=28095 RepID=UPI00163F0E6C|nr:MFS transporter [Burkholderia gladioli]
MGRAGTCMGTMAFVGALPVLREAWHMSASAAGTIQTAFNLSNAFALLAAAWLCDIHGAKLVYLTCTWAGAVALGAFAFFARSPESALVCIVFVGLTQGGAYAPALLLAADLNEPAARGRAMGQMLAAGSLGYLISIAVSLWATRTHGVEIGFSACALGGISGAVLGHLSLLGAPLASARKRVEPVEKPSRPPCFLEFKAVACCLLSGYVAHCWELLGHYAWTPSLLAAALAPLHLDVPAMALLIGAVVHLPGMLSTVMFGMLSDRWDRTAVLILVGAAGAMSSLLMGSSIAWGPGWTILAAAIGSFCILGDSGVLSAAMTDSVSPNRLGRVMGVRSVLGFGLGAAAPTTFGAAFDATHRWSWAYATLAIGGCLACCCALCLRFLPGSLRTRTR